MKRFNPFECSECKWGNWVEDDNGNIIWSAGCGAEDEKDCEYEFESVDD